MNELHNNVSNLVIVGSWNKDIFTPEWVKEYLLDGQDFQVLFPMNSLNSLRFDVNTKYSFAINLNRLEFQLHDSSDGASREMIATARKLLRCLVHTPITSFGVNFVYKSERQGLLNGISNTDMIKEYLKAEVDSTEVTRVFKLGQGKVLNFKVVQKGAETFFDFNYSYNVKNAQNLLNVLGDDDEIVIRKRKDSEDILKSVYGNE
jgi:hypothetical protein